METDKIDKSKEPLKASIFQRTQVIFTLLNCPAFVQYFNIQTLSVSMRGLERDLGFSPKKLSCFILVEELSIIVSILIWGILSDLYDLKLMLIISVLGSGIFLTALGLVSNFVLMLLLIALNGSMTGFIIPLLQKYVVLSKMRTGLAFGIVHSVAYAGKLLCSFSVTMVASNIYHGIFGWRLCCFSIAVACFLTSFTSFFVPSLKPKGKEKVIYTINVGDGSFVGTIEGIWNRTLHILSVKTVWLIIAARFFAQGIYTCAYFITLLFQYCRLSNLKSGIATSMFFMGSMFGGFTGGPISDYMHSRFIKFGRIPLGIFLISFRLIGFVLLSFLFDFEMAQKLYFVILLSCFLIGMTLTTSSIVDRSVLVDVVLPSEQGLGLGYIMMLSSVTSALIFPPLVGYMIKDVFGYVESKLDIEEMDISFITNNHRALRNGIVITGLVTTTIMVLLYCLMLATYNKDALNIKNKIDRITFDKTKKPENSQDPGSSTVESE